MFSRPETLLSGYGPWATVAIDYERAVDVYLAQRDTVLKRLWQRVAPSEFTVSFGSVLKPLFHGVGLPLNPLDLKARWERERPEIASDLIQALEKNSQLRARLERDMGRLQKKCVRRGRYAHNVDCPQIVSGAHARRLGMGFRKSRPFRTLRLKHNGLVVVDGSMCIDGQSEFCLSDCPTFMWRADDQWLRLGVGDGVRDALLRRDSWKPGWHPYCRVFGIYREFGGTQGKRLDVVVVSVRDPEAPAPDTALRLRDEWAEPRSYREGSISDEFKKRYDWYGAQLELVPDHQVLDASQPPNDAVAATLVDVRHREDELFAAPLAFLVGLNYYLQVFPGASVADEMRKAMESDRKVVQDRADDLKILQSFGVLRLREHELRELLLQRDATGPTSAPASSS